MQSETRRNAFLPHPPRDDTVRTVLRTDAGKAGLWRTLGCAAPDAVMTVCSRMTLWPGCYTLPQPWSPCSPQVPGSAGRPPPCVCARRVLCHGRLCNFMYQGSSPSRLEAALTPVLRLHHALPWASTSLYGGSLTTLLTLACIWKQWLPLTEPK